MSSAPFLNLDTVLLLLAYNQFSSKCSAEDTEKEKSSQVIIVAFGVRAELLRSEVIWVRCATERPKLIILETQ